MGYIKRHYLELGRAQVEWNVYSHPDEVYELSIRVVEIYERETISMVITFVDSTLWGVEEKAMKELRKIASNSEHFFEKIAEAIDTGLYEE